MSELVAPEPGQRCALCNRRRNKKRGENEPPTTKKLTVRLPADRWEWAEETFDTLQEFVGGDPHSYPRGVVFEALLALGVQQREELKAYLDRDANA